MGGPIGALSCAMAILGGYWPILVYFAPVAFICNPGALCGVIPALPQIVTFLWYWKRSVRAGEKIDRTLGRLPWWKLKDLFWPSKSVGLVNGVHYPEVEMYMGIAVLVIWKVSYWWVPLILSLLVSSGLFFQLQRIPSRSLYLATLSICLLTRLDFLTCQQSFLVLVLQGYLLLRNSSIYPSFPFSQWWKRPSELYQKPINGEWPNVTGYLIGHKISDYKGAFALR